MHNTYIYTSIIYVYKYTSWQQHCTRDLLQQIFKKYLFRKLKLVWIEAYLLLLLFTIILTIIIFIIITIYYFLLSLLLLLML